jgi:type 1 glutamine amidotransferase/nicotinamidase-related amidase
MGLRFDQATSIQLILMVKSTRFIISFWSLLFFLLIGFWSNSFFAEGLERLDIKSGPTGSGMLELTLRSRVQAETDSDIWLVKQERESWDPNRTAVIITDMWDRHWCESSTERVEEIAPAMNRVANELRSRGVMVIHAPSGTMDAYEGTVQRQRAIEAPFHEAPEEIDINAWCFLDPDAESDLPIDDSDEGCDKPCSDGEPCSPHNAWSKQIETIEIHEQDAISDTGQEVYNLITENEIENIIVMGVHTNMCVLGRSFAIRQMVNLGKNVVLMRDMTDSMYNPEMPPYVTHYRGTELVVEHIEKYWAPTILSSDITGEPAFRFAEDDRTHIAFLIAEDEYDAHLTLPAFAEKHLTTGGHYAFNVIQSDQDEIEGIEQIRDADLLMVYVRRRHLPESQLDVIHEHLDAGKPLIALRTSSHAFETWNEFDPEVLGGNYSGHHGNRPPADPPTWVQAAAEAAAHPVMKGLPDAPFQAASWLYQTRPLADDVTLLMTGWVGADGEPEPVTWVRQHGDANIFYTSLGDPRDFEIPAFNQLLVNAIEWAVEETD